MLDLELDARRGLLRRGSCDVDSCSSLYCRVLEADAISNRAASVSGFIENLGARDASHRRTGRPRDTLTRSLRPRWVSYHENRARVSLEQLHRVPDVGVNRRFAVKCTDDDQVEPVLLGMLRERADGITRKDDPAFELVTRPFSMVRQLSVQAVAPGGRQTCEFFRGVDTGRRANDDQDPHFTLQLVREAGGHTQSCFGLV